MAVPALDGAFPGSALVAAGCLVFTLWLGQSRVPKGILGMCEGGAPLPHTPSSLAPLCLLRALPVFRSPLENLLRTARSRCARETGRGKQAPNKEQRFNVLPVCALSLGTPGAASLLPSQGGPAPAPVGSGSSAFPAGRCLSSVALGWIPNVCHPPLGTGQSRGASRWGRSPWPPLGPGCKALSL